MRTIDKIVIHHSVTPQMQDLSRAISGIDNSHKERLHPEQNGYGLHIAYHYIIAGNGEIKATRPENEIGYHASNLEVNNTSIGICMLGHFDVEIPNEEQIKSLKNLCDDIQKRYNIITIEGHRKYAPKSCPGKNTTDQFIASLKIKTPGLDDFQKWAIDSKLCNDSNWYKPFTKYESIVFANRLVKYMSWFQNNKDNPSV